MLVDLDAAVLERDALPQGLVHQSHGSQEVLCETLPESVGVVHKVNYRTDRFRSLGSFGSHGVRVDALAVYHGNRQVVERDVDM